MQIEIQGQPCTRPFGADRKSRAAESPARLSLSDSEAMAASRLASAIAWLAICLRMAGAADDGIQSTPAMGWSTWYRKTLPASVRDRSLQLLIERVRRRGAGTRPVVI